MATTQYAQIDLNRLQAIIEKFQYSVTDASKIIQNFSRKQEDRFQTSLVTALNDKLKNPTVIIQEMQSAGIQDGQDYLQTQRSYNKLLEDQKNAFTDMTFALQQLTSKFEQQNVFTKNQNIKDTASALGVTVLELMFNRFMARHNDISDDRADANLAIVKAISDKRNDPDALKQDELVGSLANVKGNENLIQNLQNAKGLHEILLILMQAGSVAEKMKNQNALDHIDKAFGGDQKTKAMFTTPINVPTEAQKAKSQTSEGTNANDIVGTELHLAKAIDASVQSPGAKNAHDAQVIARNRQEVEAANAASIRGQGVADQTNAINEKLINNPGYTAMVTAGLQYAQQVESVIGDMGGAGGAASDLGGALMGLATKIKDPRILAALAAAGIITVGEVGYQQLSGTHDNIRPKPTAKERDDAYKVAVDEINNIRNKSTMDYLKKQGIDVQYNKEMMRFELVKNGKVVGNVGRRLNELSNNVYALINYGDRAKELGRASGGEVKLNEKTGKTALYYGGRFVSDVDLSSWKTGGVIASDLEGGIFGGGPLAQVKAQVQEEERVRRLNQSAWKSGQTLDAFNNKNKQEKEPKPTTLPSLPTTNPKPPSQEAVKKIQDQNSVGRKPPNPVNTQQHNAGKRTTAHDLQMAKECSRIESTCNNYHNDIKVIVNPPSGDPIQIANQVCEQLKRHSCGQSNGMSKQSVQQKRTGH
ncbi:unnamed protein product [Commensalibacter communis]|uniref:hypothetical protein n=2 Tax=Commensalibacter communis TaxID=2972786 RepID=UPI0022FFB9BD|nr:hypothetical protein [Commensalibacter communis]CAI3960986.1 unnamed protein product [Commensalibacter communis]CAI3961846.1 unnamed protein product [Commensalibacter communis]